MTRPKLAATLQILATEGGDAFYERPLANAIIQDLRSFSGIMTEDNFRNYRVFWRNAIELEIGGGIKLNTALPPRSGILLDFILRVLNGHLPKPTSMPDYIRTYQQITETFKYAFAKQSKLGDPKDEEVAEAVKKLA